MEYAEQINKQYYGWLKNFCFVKIRGVIMDTNFLIKWWWFL